MLTARYIMHFLYGHIRSLTRALMQYQSLATLGIKSALTHRLNVFDTVLTFKGWHRSRRDTRTNAFEGEATISLDTFRLMLYIKCRTWLFDNSIATATALPVF